MRPGSPGRLIVVSFRVAYCGSDNSDALTTLLHAALARSGGLWLGWSGNISASAQAGISRSTTGPIEYATFDLSQVDHDDHVGFSDGTLWPMLHNRLDLVNYDPSQMDGYLRVNQTFAAEIARLVAPEDTVWVNDYQLIPLAEMLRERGLENRMGFILHTPLPDSRVLAALPGRGRMLESLASYDLVGVPTRRDLRALEDYFFRETGAQPRLGGCMRMRDGRQFHAGAFSIGVDTRRLSRLSSESGSLKETRELQTSLAGSALIIGVDRLDYSNGLLQRFHAYAHVLESAPELRGKITLMQIAPCPAGDVNGYQVVRDELERYAGFLNGKFATPAWVPLRYINKVYPQAVLAGYYRTARVALVTPLCDGMNLVAMAYVACQDAADPGVLILSRFAGVAEELTQALLVNPADTQEVADALRQALCMPLAERRKRWRAMMATLEANNVHAWRSAFLARLGSVLRKGTPSPAPIERPGPRESIPTSRVASTTPDSRGATSPVRRRETILQKPPEH